MLSKTIRRNFSFNQYFDQVIQNKNRIPRIVDEVKFDFKDVLIRPQLTALKSRSQVNLLRNFKFRHHDTEWEGVPIMAANMDTVGTFEIAEEFSKEKMITCLMKHYSVEETVNWANKVGKDVLNNVAVAAGTSDRDFQKTKDILTEVPALKFICLDVANGYQHSFIQKVDFYRNEFPDKIIIAGNVVTSEITQILLQAGADIVKLGIGPGSVCTTRKQTGVGYPQLSTILENAPVAHSLGGYVVSDGGCTVPGDFSKAFGAGSDFVMAGGMFAGHNESGGEDVEIHGEKFKKFYGMSSDVAMDKYSGGVAKYRSSEGKLVLLPHKGPIEDTMFDLLGGIRSTCTYVGAQNLADLPGETTFVRVTQQINEVYGKAPDKAEQERRRNTE